MKNELTIAWKNLLNNPGRSLLTIAVIAVSLCAFLFVHGYVEMVKIGFAEQVIREQYGHFQVYPRGFTALDDPSSVELLFDAQELSILEELIFSIDAVEAVLPRLPITGMAGTSESSLIITGVAGRPLEENLMGMGSIRKGGALEPGNPGSAVIGTVMARILGVSPGDLFTVTVPNPGGGLEAVLLQVSGITDFGPEELNRRRLITTLDAGHLLHYTRGAQRLLVLLGETQDTENTESIMENLRRAAAARGIPVETRSWRELAVFYTQVIRDYVGQIHLMLIVVIILSTLAVGSTVHISVMQRIPEIGTLRAIGISRPCIIAAVLLESLLIGLLGTLAGLIMALGLQGLLEIITITLPPPPGSSNEIRLSIILTAPAMALYALVFLFITLPAALPSALRGIRVSIITAIRH